MVYEKSNPDHNGGRANGIDKDKGDCRAIKEGKGQGKDAQDWVHCQREVHAKLDATLKGEGQKEIGVEAQEIFMYG